MAASDPTEIPHIAAFAKGAQENDHQVDAVNVCQKKDSGYEGRYAGGLSSAGTKKRSQILKNSESDSTLFRLDQGVTVMEQASCFATQKSPRTPIKPKKKVADSKIGH